MIISSWNVNSIRARILNVQEYLKKFNPDIVLTQEIKTQEETYPFDDIKKLKYESYVFGQKSYNGVAILSKKKLDKIEKDIFKDKKLSEIGGKKLFCKEIEESLSKKKIDIAVHALKDMESEQNESLMIGAYVKRNDPRDVLNCNKIKKYSEKSKGSKNGSRSRRRMPHHLQILRRRPLRLLLPPLLSLIHIRRCRRRG